MNEPDDALHHEIDAALLSAEFKRDAAGKSGETLKLAVVAAILASRVRVKLISIGLANPEEHSSSPYSAVWERHPGAELETSYFDV